MGSKAKKQHEEEPDFYEVLGISRTAPSTEIRKAYYKLALKYHPDRVQKDDDKEKQTAEFQRIGRIYEVLMDSERRKIYDETGMADDNATYFSEERDWATYWRALYKKISLDDIKAFEKNYKGSIMEKEDLKEAYKKAKGDMEEILESVWSTFEDEPRFRKIIDELISLGEVVPYKKYTMETKNSKAARLRRAKAEAKEAEEYARELGLSLSIPSKKKSNEKENHTKTSTTKAKKGKEEEGGIEEVKGGRRSQRLATTKAPSKKRKRNTKIEEDEEEEDEDYMDEQPRTKRRNPKVIDLEDDEEELTKVSKHFSFLLPFSSFELALIHPSFSQYDEEEAEEDPIEVESSDEEDEEDGGGALGQLIVGRKQQREQQFNSLMVSLQSKYGKKGKKTGRRHGHERLPDEPTEEEFLAAQARLAQHQKQRKRNRRS
jgi:DnaJ family protein C protein 9